MSMFSRTTKIDLRTGETSVASILDILNSTLDEPRFSGNAKQRRIQLRHWHRLAWKRDIMSKLALAAMGTTS